MTRQDQSWQPNETQQNTQADEQDQRPSGETQRYGESGQFGQSGRLDEGFGDAEQMGEDQWSADQYARGAGPVDRPTLDEGEPQVEGRASDIDSMVGGMIGANTPPDRATDADERGGEEHPV